MKTKLLALMLFVGGSMFGGARFSHAGNVQADERGYRAPTYSSGYHVVGRNQPRDDDDRYESESARNGHSWSSDRDDVRGHAQNDRQDGRDGNRFNGR